MMKRGQAVPHTAGVERVDPPDSAVMRQRATVPQQPPQQMGPHPASRQNDLETTFDVDGNVETVAAGMQAPFPNV